MGCHPGYTDCKDPLCFMLPQHGGDFLTQPRRVALSRSLTKRYGYLSSSYENVHSLVDNMESKLFNCILSNPRHVLYQLLPPEKDTGYSLRPRSHHHTLPFTDDNMIRKNFLHRKLFRCMCRCISTYWCLYVYFDVLHSLHIVCRLVYLTHFHFCTHIHAVVIICVCQIFIKETACLHVCLFPGL